MDATETKAKEKFAEGYNEVVDYLNTECSGHLASSFFGDDFALWLVERGMLDCERDKQTAYYALSDRVDELLEFNSLTDEDAYFYGINVAFGALKFGEMLENVRTVDEAVSFLIERFDHDWKESKNSLANHGLL
jgi:hypothetical protein